MKVIKITVLLAVLLLFGTCEYSAAACITGGKYAAIGDGTVQDCQTGLIWLQNANCTDTSNNITPDIHGQLSWSDAMKWVAGLYGDGSGSTVCSLSDGSSAGDWRLPTKTEWMTMIAYAYKTKHYSSPALTNDAGTAPWSSGPSSFTSVQTFYWTSTTYLGNTVSPAAWFVNMYTVGMAWRDKTDPGFVWPVRVGQSGSFSTLRIE
jgi:hypothetical protein